MTHTIVYINWGLTSSQYIYISIYRNQPEIQIYLYRIELNSHKNKKLIETSSSTLKFCNNMIYPICSLINNGYILGFTKLEVSKQVCYK